MTDIEQIHVDLNNWKNATLTGKGVVAGYLAGVLLDNRMPALLAEVERLRAENAEHRRTIRSWQEARQDDYDESAEAEAVYCMRCTPGRLVGADRLAQHNDAHHGGA